MEKEKSKSKLRIIFLGTPEFAVESLKILIENNYNVVAVITAPDQPAGRGLKLTHSAVKEFALQHQIRIMQPVKLTDSIFLDEVKQLNADLQIVVAFRMLPEVLWKMPPLGTFNLHASLLPQYRGAAPINRAIMNGETVTGVTTFFLKHQIDTGNILFSEKVLIGDDETAGQLHDRLKTTGAQLVLKTVNAIEAGTCKETPQDQLTMSETELKNAPKIYKNDCIINWQNSIDTIYNQVRGLSPYPAAFFTIRYPDGRTENIKIYKASKIIDLSRTFTGDIFSNDKSYITIQCNGGYLSIEELQLPGKKRMKSEEFLRGHAIDDCTVVHQIKTLS